MPAIQRFAPVALAAALLSTIAATGSQIGEPILAQSAVTEVVLFNSGRRDSGSATVARSARIDLPAGTSRVRLEDLPPQLQRDSVQARVGGAARVMELELRQIPIADPTIGDRGAALDARIEALAAAIREHEDRLEIADREWRFLDRLSEKAADGAAATAGAIDLDAIASQLRFVTDRREQIQALRRAVNTTLERERREIEALRQERAALGPALRQRLVADVTIAAAEAGPVDLQLLYRIRGPRWTPAYRVRTDARGTLTAIEYDAIVTQATGESWEEVRLELSTADPASPTAPPPIPPISIDVRRPAPAAPAGGGVAEGTTMLRMAVGDEAPRRGAAPPPPPDAAIVDTGTAVAYRLPQAVTVPSSGNETRRLRIGAIEGRPQLAYVARPVTGAAPALRARIVNASEMILLPGPAALFVDGDYVGEVRLPQIPGAGEFDLFLGSESRLVVDRRPVVRKTSNTGLFGGGRLVTLDHRIELENRLPRPVTVEVWDRRPVSRTDRIEVSLGSLSRPLDTDPQYLENDAPQGLLKWTLRLDAAGGAGASAAIAWQVRISHSAEIETTPIPE